MADFNSSVVARFTIPGDVVNIYCLIDEAIVTDVKAGLTAPQQAAIEAFRFVPTALQLSSGLVPVWAGNTPVAAYFRATQVQMQSALAKYWRA